MTGTADVVAEAAQRLRSAGLIGAPVRGIHQAAGGVVEITVHGDTAAGELSRVHDAVGDIRHRVVDEPSTTHVTFAATAAPKRIQLRRSKGWRKPEGTIVVARPSKFGNPFRVGDPAPDGTPIGTREHAVALFREWITSTPTAYTERHHVIRANLRELRGADLACWCPENSPCHGDVLIELAN